MRTSRFIAFFAVSFAVLAGGCAQYSEAAVAARMELAADNAEGLKRANANLLLKINDLVEGEVDKADRATIKAVLVAVADGETSGTIETRYIEDVKKTRASIAVFSEDWITLLEEYQRSENNQRTQSKMTAAELEAARKINLFKGGGK